MLRFFQRQGSYILLCLTEPFVLLHIFILNLFSRASCPQDGVSSAEPQVTAQDVQSLVRESTLILKEPVEVLAGPLRMYRKRLQVDVKRPQVSTFVCECFVTSRTL